MLIHVFIGKQIRIVIGILILLLTLTTIFTHVLLSTNWFILHEPSVSQATSRIQLFAKSHTFTPSAAMCVISQYWEASKWHKHRNSDTTAPTYTIGYHNKSHFYPILVKLLIPPLLKPNCPSPSKRKCTTGLKATQILNSFSPNSIQISNPTIGLISRSFPNYICLSNNFHIQMMSMLLIVKLLLLPLLQPTLQ